MVLFGVVYLLYGEYFGAILFQRAVMTPFLPLLKSKTRILKLFTSFSLGGVQWT
jgi:hypothetical protein